MVPFNEIGALHVLLALATLLIALQSTVLSAESSSPIKYNARDIREHAVRRRRNDNTVMPFLHGGSPAFGPPPNPAGFIPPTPDNSLGELWCYFYNATICSMSMRHGSLLGCLNYTNPYSQCPIKMDVCYTLHDKGKGVSVAAGCWEKKNEDRCSEECEVEVAGRRPLPFCCCTKDKCNHPDKVSLIHPTPSTGVNSTTGTATTAGSGSPADGQTSGLQFGVKDCAILVVIVFVVALVVIGGVCWWYRKKKKRGVKGRNQDVVASLYQGNQSTALPTGLQLIEVRAQGRFGSVWKATLGERLVAVKISALQDKQAWVTECDIYALTGLSSHPNILQFIGAEQKGQDLSTDLWLVTDFHENGSLYDYLKAHSVDWNVMLKIMRGMACGLAHLHQEMKYPTAPGGPSVAIKPSIAHRDFKSKNVLLKADLTPCIADFGLSMKLLANASLGESHGQVGTCRYMAPEVLEGAIEFTKDAFLRIDMYACGLVMWEVLSRTRSASGFVEDYRLPFDVELGPHHRLDEMQEIVVSQKTRPTIVGGEGFPHLLTLTDTIEECWDQDAEARLPAGCVLDRLNAMLHDYPDSDIIATATATTSGTASSAGSMTSAHCVEDCGSSNGKGGSSFELCLLKNEHNIRESLLEEERRMEVDEGVVCEVAVSPAVIGRRNTECTQATDESMEERQPLVISEEIA